MKYIESPENYVNKNNEIPIFLAGGITNCPDWQKEIRSLFKQSCNGTKIVLLNPRRENFPIHDPNASYQQIKWEWNMFRKTKIILFWFSRGSLNPIVLFEYGKWMAQKRKPIFVGCDLEYIRIRDVQIQTSLERPDIKIVYSLQDLVNQIENYVSEIK